MKRAVAIKWKDRRTLVTPKKKTRLNFSWRLEADESLCFLLMVMAVAVAMAMAMASLNITLPPSISISSSLSFPSRFHGRQFSYHSTPSSSPSISLQSKTNFIKSKTSDFSSNCSLIFTTSRDSSLISVDDNGEFIVVNFYHFVFINDPEFEVSRHLSFLEVHF